MWEFLAVGVSNKQVKSKQAKSKQANKRGGAFTISSVIVPDSLLERVEKPSRYTGNEWNIIRKSESERNVKFAFCFPDVYEVGMSHLGMRILYDVINGVQGVCCERVFAPWDDMEKLMRENNLPLYALESKEGVSGFDFLGFTLQYEMCYSNVLNMLDLAGIPLRAKDRTDKDPFICAGGPCACNPEPMAEFVDFFMPGVGEEVIVEVLELYKGFMASSPGVVDRASSPGVEDGADTPEVVEEISSPGAVKGTSSPGVVEGLGSSNRKRFLEEIAKIEGVYVPSLYEPVYLEDGSLGGMHPPSKVRKRVIKDFDSVRYPHKTIVPFTEIVHDRVMLETFRGCIHGCRFCQAGYIYRPVREKEPETLVKQACGLIDSTGYEEFSLASLSTSDYSRLGLLTDRLIDAMEGRQVSFSLPSLRIDSFSLDLMEKAQTVRKSGLTFAPEAGTQRLRDVINKGVKEEDLLNSTSLAFNGGWSNIKLYFMIGLPTETYEDIAGIVDLAEKVVKEYYKTPKEVRKRGINVTVSVSSFVPKPFTPFQWEAQDSQEQLAEKQRYIKDLIKQRKLRQISYNWHDPKTSFLEAVFARGDRKTGEVIYEAWKMGCKFDGWGEFFKYETWVGAFEKCDLDPAFYANRLRPQEEIFPWDHMDYGISKKYLWRENRRAYAGELTPDCRSDCSGCGVEKAFGCQEKTVRSHKRGGSIHPTTTNEGADTIRPQQT